MMKFVQNEKVLCFHGPLMYEAKVVKADLKEVPGGVEPEARYYVHYKGWKTTWDEWVPATRLKKLTDANIAHQRALCVAQNAKLAAERALVLREQSELEKKLSAGGGGNGVGLGNTGGMGGGGGGLKGLGQREEKRGTKRGRDEEGDEYMKRPQVKISIPDVLKVQLIDDWEAITKNSQLVPLPRTPTVDQILDRYRTEVIEAYPSRSSLTEEVVAGLRLYFNKSLGNNLLYRFERGQYSDMMKAAGEESEGEMSGTYGAEHLLRLFVNLPELIAHTVMDPETVAVLKENMADFLGWMGTNQKILFSEEYENTASAYQNQNRG